MKTINPATGETIQHYDAMSDADAAAIVERVAAVQSDWRRTSYSERADCLRKTAGLLRDRAQEYAELMAREMGKPVAQGRGEIEKCAWVCEYYADSGETFLAPEPVTSDASRAEIVYRPLGVVLAVMPWNFPFWQVFRFLAPALMAGNAGLLKHAANVSGCALAIERVLVDAGFAEDLFRTLLIGASQVEAVIRHPAVAAATLTGSTGAGQAVAAAAGSEIKKTVLELGGSDPYLVLADTDLDAAVEACAHSRMINGGQSCIAAKRFIVEAPVLEAFQEGLVERLREYEMGDPLAEPTRLGPQARHDLRDELHQQVLDSIERGARLLLGGEIPDSAGAYYPATVLTDVAPGMPAYDDELFGPVAAIIRAEDERDAVRIANDSVFGLGSAIFTGDTDKGYRIAANELEAGSCFVNTFVRSDPRLPFGGIKTSGYGRELGRMGMHEFVNAKTVYIA